MSQDKPGQTEAGGLSKLAVCVSTSVAVRSGERQGSTMSQKVLVDFLMPRTKSLVVIVHPWLDDPDRTPLMDIYSKGTLIRSSRFRLPRFLARSRAFSSSVNSYLIFKVIDVVSSLLLAVAARQRIDVHVGNESTNALAGVLLKKLGVVNHTIYFNFDLIPSKITSHTMRVIILLIDRFCASRADVLWNNSPATAALRCALTGRTYKPQEFVMGSSPPPRPDSFRPRPGHSFAYFGSINAPLGVRTVILSMPAILQKVPDAHFHVIGKASTESFLDELVSLALSLKVDDRITFHGFLPDREVESIFLECKLGVAPYRELVGDSSKIRYYSSLGLPSVFSNVAPWLRELIARCNAGLEAEPSPEAYAEQVSRLLLDENLYDQCLRGCRALAEFLSSETGYARPFERALAQMNLT
jgi:glycosyltransferase involved in cell wall biosynthesis